MSFGLRIPRITGPSAPSQHARASGGSFVRFFFRRSNEYAVLGEPSGYVSGEAKATIPIVVITPYHPLYVQLLLLAFVTQRVSLRTTFFEEVWP